MADRTVARIDTPWLGKGRGRLGDWVTQRWVQATGRRVSATENPWLDLLSGDTDVIGTDFFARVAEREGLVLTRSGAPRGLVPDLFVLEGPDCSIRELHPAVVAFYERTSEYEFDVWSEWSGFFRPFGQMLALLFSRRLQQLNVPLSPLDTSLGITSEVLQLHSPEGELVRTAWVREIAATGNTLYAGSYAVCTVPGHSGPCIRVVFPLPNGNAHVILKPHSHRDGSLTVSSRGRRFGDPGFYFFVQSAPGEGWARYVATLKEDIHVFPGAGEDSRADHTLELWGKRFLRLHYRMRAGHGVAEPEREVDTRHSSRR
ncbi:MAG: hypothetical protein SX243_24700 [Acidobacteriota bacterium]|nr:hypothetical protein [Acidobacteriota bacterium]